MTKTNLLWMLGFGIVMLLSACHSEEEEAVQTLRFSSQSDGRVALKTSMDKDGMFYWTAGDRIFVTNGVSYVRSDNAVDGTAQNANFFLKGTGYNADGTYSVLYTGNGDDTSPTSVTIKAHQTQTIANDATHLGTDGDCGNAHAYSTGVSEFAFQLNHRAAYLRIVPRHDINGASKVVLKSITVETPSSATNNLCGTYTFSENTIDLSAETNSNSGKVITLTVGNWNVPSKAAADADVALLDQVCGYMVIQPGTHTLTFTYTVRVDGETSDRTFIKTVTEHVLARGSYAEVKHILK